MKYIKYVLIVIIIIFVPLIYTIFFNPSFDSSRYDVPSNGSYIKIILDYSAFSLLCILKGGIQINDSHFGRSETSKVCLVNSRDAGKPCSADNQCRYYCDFGQAVGNACHLVENGCELQNYSNRRCFKCDVEKPGKCASSLSKGIRPIYTMENSILIEQGYIAED